MKKLTLLALLLCLISCKEPSEYYQLQQDVCSCCEREKLQQFINDKVIKASNNMSDEEMEDVIKQLERTGIKIYCHREQLWYRRGEYGGDLDMVKSKIDSCDFVMH